MADAHARRLTDLIRAEGANHFMSIVVFVFQSECSTGQGFYPAPLKEFIDRLLLPIKKTVLHFYGKA